MIRVVKKKLMENGILTECTIDGFYAGIKELLDDESMRAFFQENLSKLSFDKNVELEKIYRIIE